MRVTGNCSAAHITPHHLSSEVSPNAVPGDDGAGHMKTYTVSIPMAGHLILEVEAENAEAAIKAALESDDLTLDKLENWEAMEKLIEGNIMYCPRPWEAEATPAVGEEPDAE